MKDQVTTPERVVVDVDVLDEGSVVLLRPLTPKAVEWIDKHIGPDNGYQPQYPTVLCEHRFADDVIQGMLDTGLAVE